MGETSVKVKVVQLGKGVAVCDLSPNTTVRDALASQGIPLDGMEIRVNAESTPTDQTLEDGDVVTVVPMIKGGYARALLCRADATSNCQLSTPDRRSPDDQL